MEYIRQQRGFGLIRFRLAFPSLRVPPVPSVAPSVNASPASQASVTEIWLSTALSQAPLPRCHGAAFSHATQYIRREHQPETANRSQSAGEKLYTRKLPEDSSWSWSCKWVRTHMGAGGYIMAFQWNGNVVDEVTVELPRSDNVAYE